MRRASYTCSRLVKRFAQLSRSGLIFVVSLGRCRNKFDVRTVNLSDAVHEPLPVFIMPKALKTDCPGLGDGTTDQGAVDIVVTRSTLPVPTTTTLLAVPPRLFWNVLVGRPPEEER